MIFLCQMISLFLRNALTKQESLISIFKQTVAQPWVPFPPIGGAFT